MTERSDTHDLLSAYLDHELDPNLEQQLFTQLAESSELRAQLRTMQLIQQATRSYQLSVAPPMGTTAAVFSTLGIQLPTKAVAVNTFTRLTNKIWMPVTISVLSSVMTLFVVLTVPGLIDSSFDDATHLPSIVGKTNSQGSSQSDDTESSSGTQSQAQIPSNSVRDNRGGAITGTVRTHFTGNSLMPEKETMATDVQDWTIHHTNAVFNVRNLEAKGLDEFANDDFSTDLPQTIADVSGDRRIFFQPVLPDRWELQLRSFEMRASPSNEVATKSNPWFNQKCLGVFYKLDDAQILGIETGQEAFPQNYNGIEHGTSVRYEQNLLTPWITAVYQRDFHELGLLENLYPMIRFGAGITRERWPITRASAGLLWHPAPNIGLSLGVEGTILAYSFQSTLFTTRKTGLTYGITFRF